MALKFETSFERKARCYRTVEAMYHKGSDTEAISMATGLTKLETLDTVQKIFALNFQKRNKT